MDFSNKRNFTKLEDDFSIIEKLENLDGLTRMQLLELQLDPLTVSTPPVNVDVDMKRFFKEWESDGLSGEDVPEFHWLFTSKRDRTQEPISFVRFKEARQRMDYEYQWYGRIAEQDV